MTYGELVALLVAQRDDGLHDINDIQIPDLNLKHERGVQMNLEKRNTINHRMHSGKGLPKVLLVNQQRILCLVGRAKVTISFMITCGDMVPTATKLPLPVSLPKVESHRVVQSK